MSSPSAQLLSHYPAIPPPVPLHLWESQPHPCQYLPNRMATTRAFLTRRLPADTYLAFMNANFRRSGQIIYQPSCARCRQCQSLRVRVDRFTPNKSQRRCWRKNRDLKITVNSPKPTDEKFDLYRRYQLDWHGKDETDYSDFCQFLYNSPVDSIEFEYRDASNQLLSIGICDVAAGALSTVYFYFDPSKSNRSLGTFGALWEIRWAAENGIPYYYLGYWIRDCPSMRYKSTLGPCQILGTDGVWRDHLSSD
jgi:leucyl-tRNA---protein transferase